MATRTLFLPADPVQAYLVVRDRSIETADGRRDVVLLARRGGCPGGTAVGIRVNESQVRELDDRGRYLVDRDLRNLLGRLSPAAFMGPV